MTERDNKQGFDSRPHYEFMQSVIEVKGNLSSGHAGVYGWENIGSLEEERLNLQNGLAGWGPGHAEFHHDFSKKIPAPKEIAILGTGKDGTLVKNLLETYPDSRIHVVEMDAEKVNAVKEKLTYTHPEAVLIQNRVNFITEDIAYILPHLAQKVGGFDLIDTQLLLIHMTEREGDPVYWNRKNEGRPFTNLQRVLSSIRESINEGGVFSVSDLTMVKWTARVKEGYENDPQAVEGAEKIRAFIHGDPNNGFPGALFLGWKSRGANPWESMEQLISKVQNYTGFKHLPNYDFAKQIPDSESDSPHATLLAYMAPTIPLAVQGAVKAHQKALEWADEKQKEIINGTILPRLQAAEQALWTYGGGYIKGATTRGVISVSPPLEFRVFTKVP